MKKLALVFASLALAATPVFACPHEGSTKSDNEARTAEKAKEQPKAKETDKTKAGDKTAKPSTEKKPDKVSSK